VLATVGGFGRTTYCAGENGSVELNKSLKNCWGGLRHDEFLSAYPGSGRSPFGQLDEIEVHRPGIVSKAVELNHGPALVGRLERSKALPSFGPRLNYIRETFLNRLRIRLLA
jgi:hypothetical protein